MDYKAVAKSLRWLANQFPVVEHPKDDADKLAAVISMYSLAGAGAIDDLLARLEKVEQERDTKRSTAGLDKDHGAGESWYEKRFCKVM